MSTGARTGQNLVAFKNICFIVKIQDFAITFFDKELNKLHGIFCEVICFSLNTASDIKLIIQLYVLCILKSLHIKVKLNKINAFLSSES